MIDKTNKVKSSWSNMPFIIFIKVWNNIRSAQTFQHAWKFSSHLLYTINKFRLLYTRKVPRENVDLTRQIFPNNLS